jgi:hypothetical protein
MLQQIPIIMIYPPPPIARLINAALGQINQSLAALAAVPLTCPRIYPPQPGRDRLSLRRLELVNLPLQEAIGLLYRAMPTD